MFAGGVVLHEHYLGTAFQFQHLIRGIGIFGKLSVNLGTKGIRASRKLFQLMVINPLGLIVVGHQADVSFFFIWYEIGNIPAVQGFQHLPVTTVFANAVQ